MPFRRGCLIGPLRLLLRHSDRAGGAAKAFSSAPRGCAGTSARSWGPRTVFRPSLAPAYKGYLDPPPRINIPSRVRRTQSAKDDAIPGGAGVETGGNLRHWALSPASLRARRAAVRARGEDARRRAPAAGIAQAAAFRPRAVGGVAAALGHRLPASAALGRPQACAQRLAQRRLAQRRLPRVRRLHGHGQFPPRLGGVAPDQPRRAGVRDVRRGGAVSLPPVADRRRAVRPRRDPAAHFLARPRPAAPPDAVRPHRRHAHHVSRYDFFRCSGHAAAAGAGYGASLASSTFTTSPSGPMTKVVRLAMPMGR